MKLVRVLVTGAVALLLLAGLAMAQNAISAKAGMINIPDGDVFLIDAKGGEPVRLQPKPSEFLDIKEGQTLKTAEGRVEVLLTPGSFLRMLDDSSFRLTNSRLSDVRLEALSGSLMIEAMEMIDGNSITVQLSNASANMVKGGLYRFDTQPTRLRVYAGEAEVEAGGLHVTVKAGHELAATAKGWIQTRFDTKTTDALYRWSKRRDSYIAMANVSAARQSNSLAGTGRGIWALNPYFGYYTYVPWSNTLMSAFGYNYYTPATFYQVYYNPYVGNGGTRGNGGGGFNGGGAQARSAFESRSSSAGYNSYSAPTMVNTHTSAMSAPSSSGSVSAPASSGSVSSSGGGAVSGGGGRGGSAGGRGN